MQRFRGGLVSEPHRLCGPLNSRLESNINEEEGAIQPPNSQTLHPYPQTRPPNPPTSYSDPQTLHHTSLNPSTINPEALPHYDSTGCIFLMSQPPNPTPCTPHPESNPLNPDGPEPRKPKRNLSTLHPPPCISNITIGPSKIIPNPFLAPLPRF